MRPGSLTRLWFTSSCWGCGSLYTVYLSCKQALGGPCSLAACLRRFEDNVVEPYLRAPKHPDATSLAS